MVVNSGELDVAHAAQQSRQQAIVLTELEAEAVKAAWEVLEKGIRESIFLSTGSQIPNFFHKAFGDAMPHTLDPEQLQMFITGVNEMLRSLVYENILDLTTVHTLNQNCKSWLSRQTDSLILNEIHTALCQIDHTVETKP